MHKHTNRLIHEASPYLLQHAHNPVAWYPWGEEAFAEARNKDKPIFLSIGYSTCHWCHVMERESFEDETVAGRMNHAFVNIKVDREERPDIDEVYMRACQAVTGSGGWPLTIIMTPDKKPFFAGTYFPKEARFGRFGMLDLIEKVETLWSTNRQALSANAEEILAALGQNESPSQHGVSDTIAEKAYMVFMRNYDQANGGFGSEPKFPSPHNLLFLLKFFAYKNNKLSLSIVEHTLTAMRMGGITDQLGGGFHRYSTDAVWLVPHFEKMLYDQAMLTLAYTDAFSAGKNSLFEITVHETLEYVLRDMTSPEGAFYSSEDADSEGVEGKFYLWQTDEIRAALGAQAEPAMQLLTITEDGNFSDPMHEASAGSNIPHLTEESFSAFTEHTASHMLLSEEYLTIKKILFDERKKKTHPFKDDKVLADWNGLMTAAFAHAGKALNVQLYISAAQRAYLFIQRNMFDTNGNLLHAYRNGSAYIPGMLNDYTYLIFALLELYAATYQIQYLRDAAALQAVQDTLFTDTAGGYFTSAADSDLIIRTKDFYDGAIPSGNSVSYFNLLRLWKLTGIARYAEQATLLERSFAPLIEANPAAYSFFLQAHYLTKPEAAEIVFVTLDTLSSLDPFLTIVRSRYLPDVTVLVKTPENADKLANIAPFTEAMKTDGDQPAVYVCKNFVCSAPVSTPELFALLLESI